MINKTKRWFVVSITSSGSQYEAKRVGKSLK